MSGLADALVFWRSGKSVQADLSPVAVCRRQPQGLAAFSFVREQRDGAEGEAESEAGEQEQTEKSAEAD